MMPGELEAFAMRAVTLVVVMVVELEPVNAWPTLMVSPSAASATLPLLPIFVANAALMAATAAMSPRLPSVVPRDSTAHTPINRMADRTAPFTHLASHGDMSWHRSSLRTHASKEATRHACLTITRRRSYTYPKKRCTSLGGMGDSFECNSRLHAQPPRSSLDQSVWTVAHRGS